MKRKNIEWVAFAMVFIGLPIQIRHPDELFSLILIFAGCLLTSISLLLKASTILKKEGKGQKKNDDM